MTVTESKRSDLPRRKQREQRQDRVALKRLGFAVAIGALVGVLIGLLFDAVVAPLIAWDVAAAVFVAATWMRVWHFDAEKTAEEAVAQDPSRAASDGVIIVAALASLVGIGMVLVKASNDHGAGKLLFAGLGILSVVASWAIVHTVFSLSYARLYYTGDDGGVDFNQDEPPRYTDFAYLGFTIGMTFQVSDTELQNNAIRTTALRHALLSYLFGAVIVATTINLIANLGK